MIPPKPNTVEFNKQKTILYARVGPPGSGAARYAAAMYFYNMKLMPVEMLEIYRRCSKFDDEDPNDLATYEGVQDCLLDFSTSLRKKT
ncbi:hypothetical protein [Phaeobacter sp. NW0010-22]|uniref:hypothetical protein n=1 Tax=Phaeobacter sp. NW0010-22 TaxID=3135907 RepID=UPI003102702A